jgi:porin
MPAGAAVYPLAALGVRVHAVPVAGVAILAGVFNGSPVAKGCVGDPQKCNPSGTSFPLDGDQLVIAEVQYTPPAKATGTYRLGFWVDTENFADRRFDTTGVPLASPHSNGIAQIHHDDWSIYGLLDQVLWQSRGDATALSGFLRAMGAPADRNLIGFSLDAGLALKAPLPDRVHDTAGIGVGYGRVSSAVRAFDLDAQRFGTGSFARSDETLVEATYQLLPRPWWQVQPDLQYVFNPGGGTADPNDPSRRLRNELILSLRTNITF